MRDVDLLIRHARTRSGHYVDIHCSGGVIKGVLPAQRRHAPGIETLHAEGGLVLPGLADHHLHLTAWAAALESTDLTTGGLAALARASVDATGWVRAVGYQATHAALDAKTIDEHRADVPVRVQQRSGGLWTVNTAALRLLARREGADRALEFDAAGVPTGRIWRGDDWLASALPVRKISLADVGRRLAQHGVTAVVDATPGKGRLDTIRAAKSAGTLPQRVMVLADSIDPGDCIELGPLKLVLDERELPSPPEVAAGFARAARLGRAVAVHCTTRAELGVLLAACAIHPPPRGSRIEHGAVIPEEAIIPIRRYGFTVVTQPAFLSARGDRYLAEVDVDDISSLYRVSSLLAAGVPVAFSSDAPYGPDNPWAVLRAATSRQTPEGRTIGFRERVSATEALNGFLTPIAEPGGAVRHLTAGAPADLVVLAPGVSVDDVDNPVVATVIDGRIAHHR